ncbi:MAG TPA: division/cell wall cluster transcriptional repressor MraZ [Thermoanaerobaculia bacterium]|nr:division/cell wall cluster transcriptional repressor MraZ [Thermoanaerobaculia bacterium]
MLRGSTIATIDDKGRLKVPTDFRRLLEERYGPEFFVTSVTGEKALVYPLPVWEEVEGRLGQLPATDPVRQRFLERVSYFGAQLKLDGQGRLLMPAILRDRAAMAGEVVVTGQLDHLEIWNRERFEQRLEERPFTDDDFRALSERGI